LKAHYKKRHSEQYHREGLENQENIQLMANLLLAADKAKHDVGAFQEQSSKDDETDEFMLKLKEQVVDKFANDLAKLTGEIEALKRNTHIEESSVINTLHEVKSKEEERIQEDKETLK
jgi:predicted metal-dependent peptidase